MLPFLSLLLPSHSSSLPSSDQWPLICSLYLCLLLFLLFISFGLLYFWIRDISDPCSLYRSLLDLFLWLVTPLSIRVLLQMAKFLSLSILTLFIFIVSCCVSHFVIHLLMDTELSIFAHPFMTLVHCLYIGTILLNLQATFYIHQHFLS